MLFVWTLRSRRRVGRNVLLQDRLAPVFVVTNGARLTPWGRQAQGLLARFGHEVDFARLDGMSAADMVKGGRFTLDSIEQGFREGSLQDFILIPISDTYKPLISQGSQHVSQPTICETLNGHLALGLQVRGLTWRRKSV